MAFARAKKALLVLPLALAAVVPIVGCTTGPLSQMSEANDAVTAANTDLAAYERLDREVAALVEELDAVETSARGADDALAVLARVEEMAERRRGSVQDARGAFAGIAALRVSDTAKGYAARQVAAMDLLLSAEDVEFAIISARRGLFEGLRTDSLTPERLARTSQEVGRALEELDRLREEYRRAAADAEQFFVQSGLGG